MLPSDLKPESFHSYPPEARKLVEAHLDLLRELPLILLPLLLREVIVYDWRFPMERRELEQQLVYLGSLTGAQRDELFSGFSRLNLSKDLAASDWVNTPSVFIEQLTSRLWATHQMDGFRSTAEAYAAAWQKATPQEQPQMRRLGIVVVGQGVSASDFPVFRKLRPKGIYFSNVSAPDGVHGLLSTVAKRADAHPIPYGHWYIDGGEARPVGEAITTVSYAGLQPVRTALLNRTQRVIDSGSGGPEALRTMLAQIKPQDVGLPTDGEAAVLNHFQLSLFTEGSGTQIFSTSFAQWAAREALRRAQPVTLMVRFAPRQRLQPMNELLSGKHVPTEFDPEGSLVDADMAAYYTWLNQQRLTGADQASFLAWFEDHAQAVAIGPSLPHGTVSSEPVTLQQILSWIS